MTCSYCERDVKEQLKKNLCKECLGIQNDIQKEKNKWHFIAGKNSTHQESGD